VGWPELHKRGAIGEVAGAVSILAITLALLGGVSALSLGWLRGASSLVVQGQDRQNQQAGTLISFVATQKNVTGCYIWLYNYGWIGGTVSGVYLNGSLLTTTVNPNPVTARTLAVITMAPWVNGNLTVIIGGRAVNYEI
jgi:hypothetical protein